MHYIFNTDSPNQHTCQDHPNVHSSALPSHYCSHHPVGRSWHGCRGLLLFLLSRDWDLPLLLLRHFDVLFVLVNLLLLFVRVDLPLFSKQGEDEVNKFEINEILFFSDREKRLPEFSFVAPHHQTDQYQTSNCEHISSFNR